MRVFLASLWSYRGFIFSSVRNELRSRFIRSRLGGLWMILHPLTQVAIYALILSEILSSRLPGIDNKYGYAIYLMAGTLGWSLFSELIGRCLTLFIDQGNLIKKMLFPKITLPAIVLGSAISNNVLLLIAMLAVFALLGHMPGVAIVWLPLVMLITCAFAMSLGLFLGVLNVFMRDIGQIVPILLQILFWFTPIVYPITIIPAYLRDYMSLNPLYGLVDGFHRILVYNQAPDLKSLAILGCISVVMLAASLFVFRKATPEMVDVL